MDNKDLKGLSEAYNEVYYDNLEQLSEAPFGLNPLDYLPGNSPSAVRQRQQWAKEGETQRARERVTRATQERADLNVVKTSKGYIAKPGGTSYDNKKAAQAVTLANRLNKETGLGKPPTPTKPVERKPPTTAPAESRPTPRPATPAPQPVQSTRTQRPSTGLSAPASSPRPTAAPAPRPAAPSSLSTGGRRSNSELEGKTFATRATSGGTKYEVRTPTSAELAAARNAGGGEKGVQAAVARSSNLMSGPTATPAPATPIAAAVKPATPTLQKRNQAPSRAPITQMNSYDFGKPDHITQDVASLYQSIYEAKKKVDQDKDGDNDFAYVQIARMVAAGMPLNDAIAAVRNKSYNEETELDEGRTEELKRKYTAKYGKLEYPTDTLRLNKTRRAHEKASRDNQDGYGPNPRTAIKGKQNLGQAMYKAGQSARVINAEFELWVNELLDEGYDLSEYTVDEMYEIFEESEKKLRPASERTKTAKTRAQITSQRAKERAAEKKAEALERAAQKVINQTQGRSGRVSEKPMGSEAPVAKETAPSREDVTTQIEPGEAGSKKHQRAHRVLKAAQANEEFELWINDLLDEGYDLSDYTWDELYENYQQLDEGIIDRIKGLFKKPKKSRGEELRAKLGSKGGTLRSRRYDRTKEVYGKDAAQKVSDAGGNLQGFTPRATTTSGRLRGGGNAAKRRMGQIPQPSGADSQDLARRHQNKSGQKPMNIGPQDWIVNRSIQDITSKGHRDSRGVKKPLAKSARMAEDFQFWVNDLLDEGYDLSDYTWNELYEEYDVYDLVIEHLLDEGFADDYDSANMMIERMSDEWLNEILESKN